MGLDLVINLEVTERISESMGLDTSKKMGQSNAATLMATPPLPPHSLEAEKLKRSKVVVDTTAEALNLLSASICPEIEHLRSELVGIKPVSDNFTTGQYHVLAVDDSSFDRRVVEKLLKISSFKVTSVCSALKALEVLGLSENCPSPTKSLDIDLIISDYCMPGMTGYDFLRKLKTSALREIPVVIMSSENDTNRIRSCLSEGAEEFIIKPVQLSDIKRLRSHIRPPSSLSHSSQTNESSGSTSGKRKASESHHETVEVTSSDRRPHLKLIASN